MPFLVPSAKSLLHRLTPAPYANSQEIHDRQPIRCFCCFWITSSYPSCYADSVLLVLLLPRGILSCFSLALAIDTLGQLVIQAAQLIDCGGDREPVPYPWCASLLWWTYSGNGLKHLPLLET
jgi:hypothetical protein